MRRCAGCRPSMWSGAKDSGVARELAVDHQELATDDRGPNDDRGAALSSPMVLKKNQLTAGPAEGPALAADPGGRPPARRRAWPRGAPHSPGRPSPPGWPSRTPSRPSALPAGSGPWLARSHGPPSRSTPSATQDASQIRTSHGPPGHGNPTGRLNRGKGFGSSVGMPWFSLAWSGVMTVDDERCRDLAALAVPQDGRISLAGARDKLA